jgi:effector-binding domain-containing protein
MNYEIHVKHVAPLVVATGRTHTALGELGHVMHATLATIAESVSPAGAVKGAPFAIYYNEPFDPDDIDVEMGLPIAADASVAQSATVSLRELPGGPVAFTVHVGPYEAIGAAYAALYRFVKMHGHKVLGPPREIYLRGPGPDTSPADYRTEIDLPID